MSGNSGAWGLAMWRDEQTFPGQENGISLSGGDAIDPILPTVPLGFLTLPPDGMGVPPVRNGDVVLAQRDGVVQVADYYEPRILTFQVDIPNEGCPGCPSARQAVSRLTQEWSRNCTGATLVIFSDCHDPAATEEEKVYLGPYLVHGRPRVAEVTWRRSDIGGASVLLRFDAADARLVLAQTPDDGSEWTGQQTLFPSTNENLAPDADLSGLTMTLNGATVDDDWLATGGPNGASYFSRFIIAANTTSPMTMALSGSGTSAIPIDPADVLSVAFWARKEPPGGPAARVDWTWYTAAGAVISNHSGSAHSPTADWQRFTQENIIAPALAEFVQFRLAWTGTATVGQRLDFAQAWINEGATSTAPDQIEAVGTLCVFPVFTLTNDLTAPIVVTYGPHQFTYDEDILGSPVTIDTRYGRAVQSGLDVTQFLTGDYSSPLEPGLHDVQIQTADPTDNGTISVHWENATVSG